MIETLECRVDLQQALYGKPVDVARLMSLGDNWKMGRGGSMVSKPGPGGTVVSLESVTLGPAKGTTQVKIKANLPNLMHGAGSAHGTLHPDEIHPALGRVLSSAAFSLTGLPVDLGRYRPTRIDANITGELQSRDGQAWLDSVADKIKGGLYGEPTIRRTSHTIRVGTEEEVAFYCKTTQSRLLGPGGGRLLRIEDRVYGRKCRAEYGDNLSVIAEKGAVVAKGRLEKWVGGFGTSMVADSIEAVALLFVKSGMEPSEAIKWAGIALVLKDSGVQGLRELGVESSTAYRWRRKVEAAMEGRSVGVSFTWDDIVYAVGEEAASPGAARDELASAFLALQGIAK